MLHRGILNSDLALALEECQMFATKLTPCRTEELPGALKRHSMRSARQWASTDVAARACLDVAADLGPPRGSARSGRRSSSRGRRPAGGGRGTAGRVAEQGGRAPLPRPTPRTRACAAASALSGPAPGRRRCGAELYGFAITGVDGAGWRRDLPAIPRRWRTYVIATEWRMATRAGADRPCPTRYAATSGLRRPPFRLPRMWRRARQNGRAY
jgi:hypothetical protein